MEKYIPIQTTSHSGSCNRKIYNLPVSYLPLFRKVFGSTLSKVTNEKFIKWCKDNDVTLYKMVVETVEVKIDEY
tara:strand:+ start:240 stop:461 length:222 start_codon:yes stop_codon:yes gene_type:complete